MVINPIVGVSIPIARIPGFPITGVMTIPNIATFDHGTYIPSFDPTLLLRFECDIGGRKACDSAVLFEVSRSSESEKNP